MTEPSFKKLLECDRCWFNLRRPYLCCSVHPTGVQSDRCPDFRESAIAAAVHEQFVSLDWVADDGTAAQWEPEGASYYGNESVITTEQRWIREQKEALLDWHLSSFSTLMLTTTKGLAGAPLSVAVSLGQGQHR